MALIGTIRNNGWILIALMVLALGGFILMDVVQNSQRYQAGDAATMGSVNGTTIKTQDFERYKSIIYSNATSANDFQVRQQIWDYFVEDAIVRDNSEKIGLGVSKEELLDLQFGANPSPIIQERYRGQEAQLPQIKQAIETGQLKGDEYRDFYFRWLEQEKEIVKARLQDKMINMISKAMYTPTWQAEMTFVDNNQRIDYNFIRVPFDKIPDSEVKVEDADYAAFLKENPRTYDQAFETRVINYVTFDVVPTTADSIESKNKVIKLADGLKGVAKDDSLFVVSSGGTYDAGYLAKSALPAAVADRLVSAPLDSLVGPYLDGANYTIAKILARKVIPDSVRARHILLREATPANELKVDSIMGLIRSGKARFDTLAMRVSQDPGSGMKGGDLGYFSNGMMVPEFNDVCFNTGEQGKLYKVATQFGWHIIEITGKKFIKNETSVRAAYLREVVRPSTGTQQIAKDKALALVQSAKSIEDLEKKAIEMGLRMETSTPVRENEYGLGALGRGKDAREVIRWAYNADTEVGDLSKQVFSFLDPNFFDARYVVAALKSITPKGAATVASLKENTQVEIEVRNRKKAAAIMAKIQGINTLEAATSTFGVQIDTMRNASLLNVTLPNGAGPEVRVAGAALATAYGTVSKPIVGKNGVYMVKPITEKSVVQMPADLTPFRTQATSTATNAIRFNLMTKLKEKADLKDNRAMFF
jgi:peptidyl-prolyl cis-trans isomerase D